MKRKHYLLELFNGIDDRFILEAVEHPGTARVVAGKKRMVLIAAVITLTALLVGCGIVYALKMQNLKLDDREVEQDRWVQGDNTIVSETVPRQVLTLSGLKGTPNYQAASEWYDFQQNYDTDYHILDSVRGNAPDFPEAYEFYAPYSQEMVDKVDEICTRYNLKLVGAPVKAQTSKCMMEYLGIENVLLPGAPASADLLGTAYYESGYFYSEFDVRMEDGEDAWPFQSLIVYAYSPKDCFNTQMYHLDGDDWQERNYTTKSGHEVLILRSPSYWESCAFCDVGEATVALRLETKHEVFTDQNGYQQVLETPMTDAQLNQILETINFDLQLTPGDPTILEGQEVSTILTQTQNGYTVTVKDFVTDGYTAAITLGLTAPEDVDLEQYVGGDNGSLGFAIQDIDPIGNAAMNGSGALNARSDGDGKRNTVELFGSIIRNPREGVPFPKGGKCKVFLDGLRVEKWNRELVQFDVLWKQEGTWNFEIPIEKGDWREIEFVSEPITIKVTVGWDLNGKDVTEDVTITSWKMRALGGTVTDDWEYGQVDFCNYRAEKFPTLVLKDGSTIPLRSDLAPNDEAYEGKMIPLDEVESLILIDGTKLDRQTEFEN